MLQPTYWARRRKVKTPYASGELLCDRRIYKSDIGYDDAQVPWQIRMGTVSNRSSSKRRGATFAVLWWEFDHFMDWKWNTVFNICV